jgi:hypothetical protein
MAMGQAAGTVAALAVAHGGSVRSVPFQRVHDRLMKDGAVLEMEGS